MRRFNEDPLCKLLIDHATPTVSARRRPIASRWRRTPRRTNRRAGQSAVAESTMYSPSGYTNADGVRKTTVDSASLTQMCTRCAQLFVIVRHLSASDDFRLSYSTSLRFVNSSPIGCMHAFHVHTAFGPTSLHMRASVNSRTFSFKCKGSSCRGGSRGSV